MRSLPVLQQGDQIAVGTYQGEGLLEGRAAHGVEGDVHAVAAAPLHHGGAHAAGAVVEGGMGAQFSYKLCFYSTADGGAHLAAGGPGKLDGDMADAAGPAQDGGYAV